MVATSIEVFIFDFLSRLSESTASLLAMIGSNGFARAPGNGSAIELTADQRNNTPVSAALVKRV